MDTQEGSRKWQRSDIITGDVNATADGDGSDVEPIVHDETYYRETGDCVILVGRVLFKVHCVLLERDTSAFLNMFGMPQGNADTQKSMDDNPLVLYDDVDEFRALCWIMYALPTVYMQQYKLVTADIPKLVSLYLIAHKYHFESYETFACDLLRRHCATPANKPFTPPSYFINCPEGRLQSLLQITSLTEGPTASSKQGSFTSILQNIWIARLKKTKESSSLALIAGEVLGLRSFLAELYYLKFTKMALVPIEGSLASAAKLNHLVPNQKVAVYQGYLSLQHYWYKICEGAPQKLFKCPPSTGHLTGHICQQAWTESWKQYKPTLFSTVSDPLHELVNVKGRIDSFHKSVGGRGRSYDISCVLKAVEGMMTKMKNSLADHFLGPLPK